MKILFHFFLTVKSLFHINEVSIVGVFIIINHQFNSSTMIVPRFKKNYDSP